MNASSRRTFIARAAALASAASVVAGGARGAESGRKLGFALCGLGNLSTNQLAPALQKTAHCRLTGLISGSPAKLSKWRAQYGVPERSTYTYDTMEKLADNPDIDVVYVVTPNALHAEHTVRAAQAGKHVFCEKPMEISVERCQRMIDACAAAKRQLGVAYRCQFEPHHLECMRIARDKEFGDVRIIEASFGFAIGDPTQWRLRRALSGGGALMDVGIYALQATRYLTGEEPVQVSATETKTDPVKFAEVDESIVWQAKFPSGVLASCSTTYHASGLGRVRASAQRGWFELSPAFNYSGVRGRRSDGKEINFGDADQFAAEMDVFAQSLLNHKPFRTPGEEGLRDVRIMMAIYESVRTGRIVSLT
jgi:predicted dehydrogenase